MLADQNFDWQLTKFASISKMNGSQARRPVLPSI
jgi:hypothetical protein